VLEVAPQCLGLELVTHTRTGCARGRIVEVEAYRGPDDRAAHSFGGRRTARTEAMFGPPGHAYVFLIYGIHCHINIVTGREDEPQAVLVRALEPLGGLELMQQRRQRPEGKPVGVHELCSGPGKLCRALDIDRRFNRVDLLAPPPTGGDDHITLTYGTPVANVVVGTRIGVDYAGEWANKPWRYYDGDSHCVSRLPRKKHKEPDV
jgi:DNA-3-methyladenine glycosylase